MIWLNSSENIQYILSQLFIKRSRILHEQSFLWMLQYLLLIDGRDFCLCCVFYAFLTCMELLRLRCKKKGILGIPVHQSEFSNIWIKLWRQLRYRFFHYQSHLIWTTPTQFWWSRWADVNSPTWTLTVAYCGYWMLWRKTLFESRFQRFHRFLC